MAAVAKIINREILKDYFQKNPEYVQDHWDYLRALQSQFQIADVYVVTTEDKKVMNPFKYKQHQSAFFNMLDYVEKTGQPLSLFFHDDQISVVGYNTMRFLVPSEYVIVEEETKYDDMTAFQIADACTPANADMTELPVPAQASLASLAKDKEDVKDELGLLKEKEKEIEEGKAKELAALQEQMDAILQKINNKKQQLMEQLHQKEEELSRQKQELEREILVLETQIYGLRCYRGEVISFHQIKAGKPAAIEDPVVIYQKIRYLDEELGKYVSLYGFGSGKQDLDSLLDVLKNREDIAALLAPGTKSVTVLKISRTGKVKCASDQLENMLADYNMYHENQLAILIRNGENLHIAWLDQDKIMLDDENLFYDPNAKAETESVEVEEETSGYMRDMAKKRQEREATIKRKEIFSRWFFFNILQGIIDSGTLLQIPEKVMITKENSPYIVFSLAQNWLFDDRYGTFESILEKSQDIPLQKGDTVLTGMRIGRDDTYGGFRDDKWLNNRGIGEKNRTRGLTIPGKTMVVINKVLPEIVVQVEIDVYRCTIQENKQGLTIYRDPETGNTCSYQYEGMVFDHYESTFRAGAEKDVAESYTKEVRISPDVWTFYEKSIQNIHEDQLISMVTSRTPEINAFYWKENPDDTAQNAGKRYVGTDRELQRAVEDGKEVFTSKIRKAVVKGLGNRKYYVSLQQTGWSQDNRMTSYNVNFEIMRDECIPAVFLCSTWLKYVIITGKIGNFRLCGSVMQYADMLEYLNRLLEYTKAREEEETRILIEAGGKKWIEGTQNWDVVLTEWRISNQYHSLTPARAKRFLRQQETSMIEER